MRPMQRFPALVALALTIGLILIGCGSGTQKTSGAVYYCPMHPTYTSDRPGECPICGMTLVKREEPSVAAGEHAGHAAAKSAPGERKPLYWIDAMNPTQRYDQPGKAPDGMDLVPVYPEEVASAGAASVEGRITVTISPERQQLIGVTTDVVRRMPLARALRTIGRVAYDETRLQHVHTKFEGYLEHLYVDFTGAPVQRGDKLVEIYSPELLATQQEYLLAYRAYERLKGSEFSDVASRSLDLLEAARQRLLLWDIRPEEIDRLQLSGEATKTLTLYSPYSGYVVQKMAFHGMRVMPGDTLYDIADLSRVWVLADVYEYELPYVRLHQAARMTLSYMPGRTWHGRVTYIYPSVEEKTRTVKVRLEFANPELTLKPEMFADVEIRGDLGSALAVPDSAVITTGTRSLVFVALGEGRFEPRIVEIGARLPDAFEVRSGLKDGERVVTSANFLIDSESKMKAAISGMAGSGHAGHGGGS